jgi:DNA-binding MarR family transcriptional regulator
MQTVDQIIHTVFELGRLIRHDALCREKGREGEKTNFLQIHALFIIDAQEGLTMKEFASALMITSPSATSFINRLVRMGWVTRMSDPKNRKIIRLKLSAKGKTVMKKKMLERREHMHSILNQLSSKDQESLSRILTTLHSKLLTHSHS